MERADTNEDGSHLLDFISEHTPHTKFWTFRKVRTFLENFARSRNLDPLIAETWATITSEDIANAKV